MDPSSNTPKSPSSKTALLFISLHVLPLLAGCALTYLLPDHDFNLWGVITLWLGRGALLFLLLALMLPTFQKAFAFLPQTPALQRLFIAATYFCAAPHLVLFLRSVGESGGLLETYERIWFICLTAALVVFLAIGLLSWRATSSAWKKTPSRALLFILAALAIFHAYVAGNSFGPDTNSSWFQVYLNDPFVRPDQDPHALGRHALALLAALWILAAALARFRIQLLSPIPRFSLLTLLLLISAGFSFFVLQKHIPVWSVEKRLHYAPLALNRWGTVPPNEIVSALSDDASFAFTAVLGGERQLWACNTGQRIPISGPQGAVLNALFTPDNTKLILITEETVLYRVDPEHPTTPVPEKVLDQFDVSLLPHVFPAPPVSERNVLWIIDTQTGRAQPPRFYNTEPICVNVSPDSQRVFAFDRQNGSFLAIRTEDGSVLASLPEFGTEPRAALETNALLVNSPHGPRAIAPTVPATFNFFLVSAPGYSKFDTNWRDSRPEPMSSWLSADEKLILIQEEENIAAQSLRTGAVVWERKRTTFMGNIQRSARGYISLVEDGKLLTLDEQSGQLISSYELHPDEAVLIRRAPNAWNGHVASAPLYFLPDNRLAVYRSNASELSPLNNTFDSTLDLKAELDSKRSGYTGAPKLSKDERWLLGCSAEGGVDLWKYRHSTAWWGLAEVPEFWLTVVLSCALLWSLYRDRKTLFRWWKPEPIVEKIPQ